MLDGCVPDVPAEWDHSARSWIFSEEDAAEKEDIWQPNEWKRSNLMFTSFTMGLFCCVVAEFSYWQYLGRTSGS